MHIEKKLFDDLVDKLARVPLAKTSDGRNTLLVGIPHKDWQRNEQMTIDIINIIDQSKEICIGEKEELDNWCLLFVIDNALKRVEGVSLATDLKALRQQCVACWENEHTSPQMPISLTGSQSIHETTGQVISIDPGSNENLTPLDSDVISIQQEEVLITFETTASAHESHQTNPYEFFFNTSSIYISNIQQNIDTAFMPFKDQPLGYAEPKEYRKSLHQLKQTSSWLQELLTFIDSTKPLPRTIAKNQDDLIERLQFLADQIHHLMAQIDKGSKDEKEIKNRFTAVENEIRILMPFMVYLEGNETLW